MDFVASAGFSLCLSFGKTCNIYKEPGCPSPLLPESLSQSYFKFKKEAPTRLFQGLMWPRGAWGLQDCCVAQAGRASSGIWLGEDRKAPGKEAGGTAQLKPDRVLCKGTETLETGGH